MAFKECNEFALSEIASFSQGYQVPVENQFEDKQLQMTRFIRIVDYTKSDEKPRYIYNPGDKYFADKSDIIMIRYGSKTAGQVVRGIDGIIANNMFKINFDKQIEVDKEYAFYALNEKRVFEQLNQSQSSSTMPAISFNMLTHLYLKIPNIEVQKAIANILSSLDDKIELNNKINKNLEELAQTLYKRWFVDFDFPNEDGEPYKSSGGEMVQSELGLIPKGWRISKLDELLTLVKESTKPGEHLQDRIYVPIDTLQSKHLVLSDHKPYTDANSSLILFDRFDILMGAMRVYFHKVNLSFNQGVTRTTTFVFRSKSIYEVPFNLLTINQDVAIDYANGTSKGSTMPYAVWENALNRYEIVNPNIEVKKKFFNLIMPILQILNNNNIQNYKLQKTRDELLPKLLSGEIEVPIEE